MIALFRPGRDRRRFPMNGRLALKSGHSEPPCDGHPHTQTRHSAMTTGSILKKQRPKVIKIVPDNFHQIGT